MKVRILTVVLVLVMLLPIGIYVGLVFHYATNVPFWDDFDSILGYMNLPGHARFLPFPHSITNIRSSLIDS